MFVRQKSYKMQTADTKWVLGHQVTPHDTSGDYDLMVAITPAGMQGPPPHSHHSFKESFLIVEGEMQFVINGETRMVRAGESVDVPPHTVHTFNNVSDQPCTWVNIHSPKGFRAFFEKIGVPANTEEAFEQSLAPERIQEVVATAADYDMRIVM